VTSRDALAGARALPVPKDDGAARHLVGAAMPPVTLPATDGRTVDLASLPGRRTVLYCYPRTGRPGEPSLTPDWDAIPGARGCTPESCSFRDHYLELRDLGADVYGVATQDSDDQREAVARLGLPFALLSDADLELTGAMRLPTFTAAGHVLIKRLTLVVRDGHVEHLWYPVFPPDRHAEEVVAWLRGRQL
jgi:peroxiredoxin